MSQDEIEARKLRAERGWLADPPPRPPRETIPGEENKWFLMMGSRRLPGSARTPHRPPYNAGLLEMGDAI